MTDKLRAAAEMALKAMLNFENVVVGRTSFHKLTGDDVFSAEINALHQALDQLPDTTEMIDTGIDRGAWSDVPDATKWVDELRGDDEEPAFTDQGVKFTCGDCPQGGCCEAVEPPNSTTDVMKPVAWIGEEVSGYRVLDWDKEDLQREYPFVYPLYTAPPKREWVGLTAHERRGIKRVIGIPDFMDDLIPMIEAKLKKKNT